MGDGEELGVRFTWRPCRGAGELELLAACAGFLGEEGRPVHPRRAGWATWISAPCWPFHQVHRSAATLALAHRPPAAGRALCVLRRGGAGGAAAGRPGRPSAGQSGGNRRVHPHGGGPAGAGPGRGRWPGASPPCWTGGRPCTGSPGGTWRELTDGEAYLDAAGPTLCRQAALRWDAPRTAPGVWSASPLPPSVRWCPPCYNRSGVQGGRALCWAPTRCWRGAPRGPPGPGPERSALLGARRRAHHPGTARVLCLARRPGRGRCYKRGPSCRPGRGRGDSEPVGAGSGVARPPGTRRGEETHRLPHRGRPEAAPGLRGRRHPGGGHRGRADRRDPARPGRPAGPGGHRGPGLGGRRGGRGMLAQAAGSGAAAAGGRVLSHDAPCPSAAAWLRRAGPCRCPFLSSRRGSGPALLL